jgi:AhpD family alkylhydroperoxidase
MKSLPGAWVAVLMVGGGLVIGGLAIAQQPPAAPRGQGPVTIVPPPSQSRDAVLKDIERTVGFVPAFFREVAPAQLPSFWAMMKDFQLARTKLDSKTKELIGLAVAAQIPCEYCVMFHTQSAKANGATDGEIEEAVGMAAMTRLGSTVLNGLQVDRAQFKRDLDRMAKPNKQARK